MQPIATPPSSPTVLLRPVAPEDGPFLFELYGTTREEELALVSWDPTVKQAFLRHQYEAQLTHYQSYYPTGVHQIITLDERPIGRVYTARLETELHVLDLALLPAHRGHGIGTALMRALMHQATLIGLPLTLYVFAGNSGSRRFHDRLGFVPVGGDPVHILMEWRPPPDP